MEISGRFVGLFFTKWSVSFSEFGENYRFWVRIGFWGGFINMHSFFVFLFGNNRFLDTISILIPLPNYWKIVGNTNGSFVPYICIVKTEY